MQSPDKIIGDIQYTIGILRTRYRRNKLNFIHPDVSLILLRASRNGVDMGVIIDLAKLATNWAVFERWIREEERRVAESVPEDSLLGEATEV